MVSASSNTARGTSRNDSAVPTGLAAEAPASPGTEVPGYSLCVPNGTQRPSSDDPADRPSPLGAPQVGLMLEGRQTSLSPFQGLCIAGIAYPGLRFACPGLWPRRGEPTQCPLRGRFLMPPAKRVVHDYW